MLSTNHSDPDTNDGIKEAFVEMYKKITRHELFTKDFIDTKFFCYIILLHDNHIKSGE